VIVVESNLNEESRPLVERRLEVQGLLHADERSPPMPAAPTVTGATAPGCTVPEPVLTPPPPPPPPTWAPPPPPPPTTRYVSDETPAGTRHPPEALRYERGNDTTLFEPLVVTDFTSGLAGRL
jgi:hypothetical protein